MDIKEATSKGLKGCGCLSIGMFLLVMIIGIFAPDPSDEEVEKLKKELSEKEESEKTQQDSVVVNDVLEGDPYQVEIPLRSAENLSFRSIWKI